MGSAPKCLSPQRARRPRSGRLLLRAYNPEMNSSPEEVGAPEQFATARLRAYRLQPEHFALLLAMHQDGVTMATLGGVRSEQQTREYLRRFLTHWNDNGFGMWVLYDREQRFVGRTALRRMELGGHMEVEAGCALLAPFWKQGLASEIVSALVEMAFTRLGLPNVAGFALPDNRASIRILEKLGFAYEKDVEYAGRRHVLYRLKREQFASHNASPGVPPAAAPGKSSL